MNNKCVIVIPIYKDNPMPVERASFKQGLSVLKKYDIVVITHKECNINVYNDISKEVGKNFSIEYFDMHYFSSVDGYNDLCYSVSFYERFEQYEYMLIYQLDAWVFKDELEYWCDKEYDYIGAPLYYAYNGHNYTYKFAGVGNGGFSLRRISHCLEMLRGGQNKVFIKPIPLIRLYWNYYLYSDKFKKFSNRIRIIPTVLSKIFGIHNTIRYYAKKRINEDMIFGTWATCSWSFRGNIPSEQEAAMFSFEVHPEKLYKRNGNVLPFGCHAFEKWEYDSFWKKHIKI